MQSTFDVVPFDRDMYVVVPRDLATSYFTEPVTPLHSIPSNRCLFSFFLASEPERFRLHDLGQFLFFFFKLGWCQRDGVSQTSEMISQFRTIGIGWRVRGGKMCITFVCSVHKCRSQGLTSLRGAMLCDDDLPLFSLFYFFFLNPVRFSRTTYLPGAFLMVRGLEERGKK